MGSSWNQFKNAIGSTTAGGSASSYSGDPAFDAWQRYRSEIYGNDFEESEKERKRREKELERLNKKKDVFAERGKAGVEKWGDAALGENKQEIVPKSVQATQRAAAEAERLQNATRPAVNITAGAAVRPEVAIPTEDTRAEDLARTNRAIDRIQAEHDAAHLGGNAKTEAESRLKELGIQADDKANNTVPAEVKAKDKQLIQQLDQKVSKGRVLTPDEEVQYSNAKMRGYYDQYNGLEKLMQERNDYYSAVNKMASDPSTYANGRQKYAFYAAQDKLKESEEAIKKLTGWSDDELKGVLLYADRAQDRRDTQAQALEYEIDPNATTAQKWGKGLKNTGTALIRNGLVANANAIYNDYTEDRPTGFGANLDDPSHRTINNAYNAMGATRQRIQEDAGDTAAKAYDIAYSAADSGIKRIGSMLVAAGAGETAGKVLGLVPFALSAYNTGYKEARERGATESESRAYGVAEGAIETITEMLPLGNAVDAILGKNVGKSVVKEFVRQIAEEGLEEGVGTLVSEAADYIIFNDDPEVQYKFQQRVEETGSVGLAVIDLLAEAGSEAAAGALSSMGMSGINIGVQNSDFARRQAEIRKGAGKVAESINGESEYEKSAKAQMEQYEQNPTRYIADNLAENNDADRERKKRAMEIANKEANGEKISLAEKLFINDAIAKSNESNAKQEKIDREEGKTEEVDDSNIPIEYRDKMSNITEDEAREMLGKAANSGDTDAFIDAMQMTMNSSYKEVADKASEIIADYVGHAQSHGITAQAIAQARLSRLEAYKAGREGRELTDLSDKNQIAYNEGKIESINEKKRTQIGEGVLQNAQVTDKNGNAQTLKGVFTNEGIKTESGTIKLEDLDISDMDNNAVLKAYRNADSFKDVSIKNAYLTNIKPDTNIGLYDKAFHAIYDSALAGVDFENAKKSGAAKYVDEDSLKAIYEIGQVDRKNRASESLKAALGLAVRKASGKAFIETNQLSAEQANYANILARTLGVDIRVIDSSSERKERGSFNVNKSLITVEADDFKESLAHEMTEFIGAYNKEGYDALKGAVSNFAVDKIGNDAFLNIVDFYADHYKTSDGKADVSADNMSGEMFNDLVFHILGSKKGQKAFAEYLAGHYEADEAKTIGQQLAERVKALGNIIKKVFGAPDSNSPYSKLMSQYSEELGEYADQFIEALDVAIKNYKAQAKMEAEEELDKVSVENGETRAFSIKTYETQGRSILEDYLKKYSGLSKKDQKDILETLDWGYEKARELAANPKYASFSTWSDTDLTVAPDGTPMITIMGANKKPLQSAAVSNGEYPLNIDFTQVCKKRIALNNVLNKLVSDADLNIRMLTESDVAGINRLIKEHGFEIACGLCFVDAKRYRVGSWATSFTDGKTNEDGVYSHGWNELVNSMLKKGVSADYFDLAAEHTIPLGTHLSDVDEGDIDFKLINKIIKPYLKTDKKGKQTIGQTTIDGKKANPTEEVRMAWLLKSNPAARHLLDHNDIIASEGLDKLRIVNPDVYALVNSHGGTNKPKLSHGFTAYGNEILRSGKWGKQKGWGKANDFNAQNAYEVGGVRVQSFSDYVANMFFDYMQMFADMSARELPSHAYTKEQDYVKLFGMTGQRINMSLIFKGAQLTKEQQARYDELAKKGVNAIKADPEFKAMAEHAGLDDKGNYIYEDESFPPEVAYKLRKDSRYKNCGTIAVGLSNAHIKKLLADPQIDMVIPYHSSGVSPIIRVARNLALYTDYTNSQNTRKADGIRIDKKNDYDWYGHLASEINPNGMTLQETVEDYKNWCKKNNYLPVFDEFADDPNYWKLLVDFRSYDNDGNFMPQGKVTMTFPDDFEKIVKKSLAEQQKNEDRMVEEMSSETDTLYSEVKEFLGQSGAIKYSMKINSEGNPLTEGQADYFKNSDLRDENGNLKVMYHGTTEEFYTFDPKKFGGKNGTAEGFGIYLTDDPEVSDAYGGRILKGYANVTHPAYSNKKTITANDLVKLIKATAEKEAQAMVDDGEYDSFDDAIKDSWVSNWVYTYDMTMPEAYKATAQKIIKGNSGDMDIIRDVMGGLGIREYDQAYDFYATLQDTLGIDGFITDWKDKTGQSSQVAVVFNSNQFKSIDNLNPTDNEDIRYSINMHNTDFDVIRADSDINLSKEYITDEEFYEADKDRFKYMASKKGENLHFYNVAYSSNHVFLYNNYSKDVEGYGIIAIIDADSVDANIHEAKHGEERVQDVIDSVNEKFGDEAEVRGRVGELSVLRFGIQDSPNVLDKLSRLNGRGAMGVSRDDSRSGLGGEEKRKGSTKYSIKTDNKDRKLSVDQIRYFKNSKIVDEDGRLKVMYHGTNEAKFTIFDPQYSDDEISLFFTDNRFVAAGYAGTDEYVDPYDLRTKEDVKTLEDLNKRFEDTDWAAREEDGEIIIDNIEDPDDPIEYIREDSVEKAYKEWVLQYVWDGEEGEFGGIYEVYLNITNPLVIDANGSNWDEIVPEELIDDDADYYDKIHVVKKNEDGTVTVDWALSGGNGGAVETMTDDQFRKRFGDDVYHLLTSQGRSLWLPHAIINPDGKLVPGDTRGLASYARNNQYDGLVINNLVDIGEYGSGNLESQVVIAFNSEQIKSVNNKKPTSDPDIRYSIKVDSKGRDLTDGQRRYFNNSKNLTDDGALRVMYHGTESGGFTVFDPEYSDDNTSLFFSDNIDVADSYQRSKAHMFNANEPISDEEITTSKQAVKYMESIGYSNFKYDAGSQRWSFTEPNGNSNHIWDHYFIPWAEGRRTSTNVIYEVYLNIENPLVIDAQGNQWNRLTGKWLTDKEAGRVVADLVFQKSDDGIYKVWSNELEYEERPMSLDDIGNLFGEEIYKVVKNNDNVVLPNILYYPDTRDVYPNDTRSAAQMAKGLGYDGVIIKNVKDNGGGAGFDTEKFKKASKPSTVAIAFSPEQVKDVNNLNPTSSDDIRYSLGLDDDPFLDFSNYGTSEDVEAVEILKEGMEALKNADVDESKVRQIAHKLRKEYGSTYSINELVDNLMKAFAYMQTEDHVDYKTMMGILKDIAKPVIEASNELEGEEDYKAFVQHFKGIKIKLTDKQKAEVAHSLGSYGAYCRAMMPITISDNGTTTLDQLWDELVEQSGFALDRDATEGDKPLNLLDVLQALRPTTRNIYGGDIEDVSKDLAMRIVEEYVGGETAKKMQKQIADYRDKLKKDFSDRIKQYEGKANARIIARNKRKAEEAAERQKVRDLRQAIKIDAKKLMHWIEKPTENYHVPHDLVMPIMQFLNAFDFVDPDIMVGADGKWHTKVLERYDIVNGHAANFVYKDISGDTRDEVLQKFNEALGNGEGTKEQRAWAQQMTGIKEIYDQVLHDEDFEDNNMDFLMQTLDAEGLAREFDTLLARNKDSITMNHLSSEDLTLLNNIIKNIFKAVNQGNKAYTMNADISNLAQQTIKDAKGRELKDRNKFTESVYNFFRINNATPRTFFKLLGSKGIDIFKSMRRGQNTEIVDIKKASEFMEGVMDGLEQKELRKWTGKTATIHEVALSDGTVRMTDGQIMSLYLTLRRNGAMDRIKGGIRPGVLSIDNRNVRQNVVHLSDGDISKLEAILTPKQIEVAKKIQKYMADDCSKQGNETSMTMYGYKKFVDPTYYPWRVDKDTVATTNTSENIPMFNGIERSGFTKQLKEGATNPLIIDDIFDVFTDHVTQMAAYHGYAASLKDVMRWMNYREKQEDNGFINWITNKNAINVLSGTTQGVNYIKTLLLDINKANKSQYIGFDALMGNFKASAVGANARVVIQQPTAYFRALNMIDAKYLMGVNPRRAMKNIKVSQDQSPISWWKSKGYYETNLGQPLKEIVTGITSKTEAIKDKLMAPAGLADDMTWGFLYTAVENEQRDKLKGQKMSDEEFRKAVNDRFDEVIDNTQVVDTTLHRSQYMRSKDALNKIQTAFMAEPTKTYNMLMEALIEDMNDENKTVKRFARASAAFMITALVNAAAQSSIDVLRHKGDDEEWWEKFMDYIKSNFLDNVNPFNMLPILKELAPDLFSVFSGSSTYGTKSSRYEMDALTDAINAFSVVSKYIKGESNKTGYGVVMSVLKPVSELTGIPVYNLTRDTVALYNAFFENLETTVKKGSTAKNEKKKDVVSVVDKEKSEDTIRETINQAIEHGVSIYDLKGGITSEYKNKYFDAYSEGDMDKAKEIANKAAGGFVVMGLSDEEIDEIINGWQEEAITYSALDKAIADGKDIEKEIAHVQEGKDDDKIVDHIMNRFASTVKYEDANNTESEWRENVEKALQAVDATLTFDAALEEAEKNATEKAEKAAEEEKNKAMRQDFFDAVEKKDGSAGRKALQTMKDEGIEAKTVKSAVSTKYHDEWKKATTQAEKDKAKADWKSAYTLVNNVYGSSSNNLDQTWAEWEKKQSK